MYLSDYCSKPFNCPLDILRSICRLCSKHFKVDRPIIALKTFHNIPRGNLLVCYNHIINLNTLTDFFASISTEDSNFEDGKKVIYLFSFIFGLPIICIGYFNIKEFTKDSEQI